MKSLVLSFLVVAAVRPAVSSTVEVMCSQPNHPKFGIYLNGEWVDSFKFPIVMASNRGDVLRMSYCSGCCGSYCGYPTIKTVFDSTVGPSEINVFDYRSGHSFSFPIGQSGHLYEDEGRQVKCTFLRRNL